MEPTIQSQRQSLPRSRNPHRLLVFLVAGLKIAFRGICAKPDRSPIGRRVLLAPAELDSATESR
jgi:hypothetical protein